MTSEHQNAFEIVIDREAVEAMSELCESTGPFGVEHMYRIVEHSVNRVTETLREWE